MSDLTDRMRTCAAFLLGRSEAGEPWASEVVATLGAADLLIEASNLIEATDQDVKPDPNQSVEPFKPFKPFKSFAPSEPAPPPQCDATPAVWVAPGGTLPGLKNSGTISSRACPSCDSRAYKRVFRRERKMYLHCGACGREWPFAVTARAS